MPLILHISEHRFNMPLILNLFGSSKSSRETDTPTHPGFSASQLFLLGPIEKVSGQQLMFSLSASRQLIHEVDTSVYVSKVCHSRRKDEIHRMVDAFGLTALFVLVDMLTVSLKQGEGSKLVFI